MLFTARIGGIVISKTQAMLDRYGVSEASADARDAGGVSLGYFKVDPKLIMMQFLIWMPTIHTQQLM